MKIPVSSYTLKIMGGLSYYDKKIYLNIDKRHLKKRYKKNYRKKSLFGLSSSIDIKKVNRLYQRYINSGISKKYFNISPHLYIK